jgi:4-hydroxythreonine-4-phosphate dehydrogenase
MTETTHPTLGLFLGDRNGIGPEIAAKLLAQLEPDGARAIVIGDPDVLADGCRTAEVEVEVTTLAGPGQIHASSGTAVLPHGASGSGFTPGEVSAAAGSECLDNLAFGIKLASTGVLDGFVFAPLNKAALHAGGLTHEDETRYMQDVLAYDGPVGELNVLDKLWTSRVTSHVPLRDVADMITHEALVEAINLLNDAVGDSGIAAPRLAVCGLNPHAGDGGNFGREEIDVIEGAIAAAQQAGITASGPWPPDTVFVRAKDGEFDGVVTMYHDQGQIAMKLMGFGSGVTVAGGLPVPVTTCAHGTAYDIAGKGIAGVGSMAAAWDLCTRMAASRRMRNT